jgi:serine/threonine protein phosphatase PrpC
MRKIFNIFRRKKNTDIDSIPVSADHISNLLNSEINGQVIQIISGSAIDVGRRRENNEDALLSFSGTLAQNSTNQVFGFFAIADGMGGHRNGELASENALRGLGDYVMSKLYHPLFGPNPKSPNNSLREIMEEGFIEAHKQVQRSSPGGGCTLTAALVFGKQLVIAHLGDSRAYSVYKDGRIQALTDDHTLVNRLVELGEITPEEALVHPQKSVLIRALGQGTHVEADIFTSIMPLEGHLLLCSDGLWGVLSDKQIQQIVNSAPNPNEAAKLLVEAANNAGGPDNISVVLIQVIS